MKKIILSASVYFSAIVSIGASALPVVYNSGDDVAMLNNIAYSNPDQVIATQFSIADTIGIDAFSFFGIYDDNMFSGDIAEDNFTVTLYQESADLLPDYHSASNLSGNFIRSEVGSMDLFFLGNTASIFEYEFRPEALNLVGDTNYWISFTNDVSSDASFLGQWAWFESDNGLAALSYDQGQSWASGGNGMTLSVTSVSEPSALFLMFLGVAGLLVHRKRRDC